MTVTIQLDTDADPSLVLELAQEAAESLARDLEDHGETAGDAMVSVQD